MTDQQPIKTKLTRIVQAFDARPSLAKSTDITSLRMGHGLACTATQADWSQTIDMPTTIGGTNTGPTPGFFGRACVISCIAIGIKLAAAMDDIEITGIEIEMETDWDDRGLMGFAGVDAGCQATRIEIEIISPHSQDVIEALVAKALERDPWYLSYIRALKVSTAIRVRDGVGRG